MTVPYAFATEFHHRRTAVTTQQAEARLIDWLLLGEGEMFKTDTSARETERTEKLIDTITTLQESINAKNDTISTLTEKIKQLETQQKK